MKLTEHLFFYRGGEGLPLFGRCSGNSYVIRGEHLTLTDPGPSAGPRISQIRREMNADGFTFQDINKVILTHAHPDHSLIIPWFMDKYRVQVYAHPLEKRVLEEPGLQWREEYEALGSFSREVTRISRRNAERLTRIMFGPSRPASGIIPVREGAMLNLGTTAEIIELPGHRPGEIGIHLPEDRALITGDLINYKRKDLPSLNLPLSDLKQAVASLKKIQSMDIDILAPSHDQPVAGKDRIQEWVASAVARCELMRAAAEENLISDPGISLAKLGPILAGDNEGVPAFEKKFLAWVVLKSLEPENNK